MRVAVSPSPHSRSSLPGSSSPDWRWRLAALAATLLLALVSAWGLAVSARAATYTVGTQKDLTGECLDPAGNTCSLRQLIEYENALPTPPNPTDGIVVPGGTYNLTNGALAITQTLTITGAGGRTTMVDVPVGTPAQRVFEVKPPANGGPTPVAIITGLEISGGTANAGNGFFGGDVYNSASVVLNEDWITEGTASSGGGISNDTGTMLVEHSLVWGNHASSLGADSGGIQNHGSEVCGTTCSPGKKAVLVLEDSTVTGNDARLGAGIYSWTDGGVADENQVSIINSTIAYNNTKEESCTEPECGARGPGGGLLVAEGKINVVGSIVAYNHEIPPTGQTNSNCATEGNGTIVSVGYNLETEADCNFTSTGDLQNQFTSFLFNGETPENNGGNTDTLTLDPSSPAVDAIPTNWTFCGNADQRGVSRPQGTGCDIGAVEVVPFTVQATEGSHFSGQVATTPSGGAYSSPAPTIEWGDGQTSEGTVEGGIDGSHTYAEEGTFNGLITYHNDFGSGTHTVAFVAKVADAPLTATGVPTSATAGTAFSATVATFTDADPAGTPSDYTATIDWGDGGTSAGAIIDVPSGGFSVSGSHTYAAGGAYSTTVVVSDAGGASATATSTADVNPAPQSPPPPPPPPAAPTLLGTAPPSVITTTSAVFTATVNPNGLPTTVHFEYGGTFGGVTVASITYGSSTPNQSLPADFASHTITATVTGLLPNVTYHVRAVATNSAGNALGADQILQTPADPPPPPPVLGKTANVSPVSGIVYIELPPGATLALFSPSSLSSEAFTALTKGQSFIPLTEARQIPFGSILDTSKGVAHITTATTASPKGKLQFGDFGAGLFKLLQARKQQGLTELNLIDNHPARQLCATIGKGKKASIASSHPSQKVLGRLTANSRGHFTGRGQYSAATVRGTTWAVTNRCDGTLTRVVRGELTVRDFRLRKTVTLFTGQSYLARAR
jgi:hypothetical protein